MQSSSRRAFLTGRRTSGTPWEAFCQRLRRMAEGSFYELAAYDGAAPSARLAPKQASDVHHALRLCAEYGVQLALDGVSHPSRMDHVPVLWVEPGRDMAACQRLAPDSTKWFVQPGCLLGELEAAGLSRFADLPCHITVASWLADRSLCDFDAGQTHRSGLDYASVLLPDGTVAGLGPFGTANRKPLEGLRLQQLIPALFRLAGTDDARACLRSDRWRPRYRLDALAPADGQPVNLAHLLLGHGGDLGWVEWLVLEEQAAPMSERPYDQRFSTLRDAHELIAIQAADLDSQVKQLFDPDGVFPHPGQDL